MKKTFIIALILLLITLSYPPTLSQAEQNHSVKKSILNYLRIENSTLKYQLNKDIADFRKELKYNK